MTLTGRHLPAQENNAAYPNYCRLLNSPIKLVALLLLLSRIGAPIAEAGQQIENGNLRGAKLASIDINHASAEDFAKLPGIGPELARRIVAYRTKHGPFHRVEDLLVIRGIGPKKWKALRPYLRVYQEK